LSSGDEWDSVKNEDFELKGVPHYARRVIDRLGFAFLVDLMLLKVNDSDLEAS
jgi:hypothetical protein